MSVKIRSAIKLEKAGRAFRRKVLAEFVLEDTHDIRRLDLAAHCLDRIAACQATIEAEGLFIEDRFQQKREHPAAKAERDNKALFMRLVRELGLDLQAADDTRPPRQYGG